MKKKKAKIIHGGTVNAIKPPVCGFIAFTVCNMLYNKTEGFILVYLMFNT